MARVIVWNLVTLDGLFEGPTKWDLAFHGDAWCDELAQLSQEFGDKAGLLVFGRVTYEGMKAYWTSTEEEGETKAFMNGLPKLVASRSLTASDWNNTQVTADIAGEIARRKAAPGKDIYVFGSAELVDSLLREGLVDEIMLCVVPVVLGAGTPLFKPGSARRKLALTQARPLSNGAVILNYDVAAEALAA
ncbi:dihydrofolate reductase family protein [Bosea sp. 124]|uniref:dihydrofolate reductase family protein n=1 Tax=Bosea sp. 124 TaxID=2135642 RepID=UPI000D34B466|nr:dihydrofolate reductase family protein [Bosea sp. 124]PTM40800.1 dihydrofolate reductase [Bosea sp. 124]